MVLNEILVSMMYFSLNVKKPFLNEQLFLQSLYEEKGSLTLIDLKSI